MTDKFMTFRKDDLQAAARLLHVEFDADATKQEITAAIYDAGHTEDDYYARLGIDSDYSPQLEGDSVEEPAEDENEEPAEPAEDEVEDSEPSDDDVAYGRFTGRNLRYVCEFGRFSRQRPVFQTTEAKLKEMITTSPTVFRRALPSEEGLA